MAEPPHRGSWRDDTADDLVRLHNEARETGRTLGGDGLGGVAVHVGHVRTPSRSLDGMPLRTVATGAGVSAGSAERLIDGARDSMGREG